MQKYQQNDIEEVLEQLQQDEPEVVEPVVEEFANGSIVYLNDDISNETINPIVQHIIYQNIADPDSKTITLFIDSSGGDISAALKLIDAMEMSRIPVRTVGWGTVASSALLIFMCGSERLISKNASVLSHQATFNAKQFSAKLIDFESHKKEFNNISERVVGIYSEKTGQDAKYVRKHLLNQADQWLTGEEVLQHGMADDLLQNRKELFWELIAGGELRYAEDA